MGRYFEWNLRNKPNFEYLFRITAGGHVGFNRILMILKLVGVEALIIWLKSEV